MSGFAAHKMSGYFGSQKEGGQYKIASSAFGVRLILTADIYQKSMRLAKYSIMFLVFTFAAFFFSEIINKRSVHPIQYILMGMAVLIFYTLVLSLSEHMQFNYAYILSAASVCSSSLPQCCTLPGRSTGMRLRQGKKEMNRKLTETAISYLFFYYKILHVIKSERREIKMVKITKVSVLKNYCLELVFDDGMCGVVDLSDLAGKGVFNL